MAHIRQAGDPILHKSPKRVDWSLQLDLGSTIAIMQKNLHETGGIGIAANQCEEIADPLQIIIVGTDDEEARMRCKVRYPEIEIPQETVMINPKILTLSGEPYYPKSGEGCLSVKGSLRGRVKRYPTVSVEYDDLEGQHQQRSFHKLFAHVIQHECDHLNGIVYLQKILGELTPEQHETFFTCVSKALETYAKKSISEFIVTPELIFDRQEGTVVFTKTALLAELKKMDYVTLEGLQSLQ